jgi:hypothetical protein
VIEYDEKEVLLAAADKVLGVALEGSLDSAAEALRRFKNLSYASSVAGAKLLHGVNANWQEWEHDDQDTFLAWAVRETGMDLQTVKKRVCEWEFLNGNYVPKPYRSKIADYTVRQLDKVYSICVSAKENKEGGYLNFIEEDYAVSEEQWLALSEACDEEMTGEVVREIKGKEKNSNHMSLKIDDDGTLWVYQGKTQETIGQLFVAKENEVVQKAIRRITENSGITERTEY